MYYSKSIPQVLKDLKTDKSGLSSTEAEKRLKKNGLNELPKSAEKATAFKIFVNQWRSPLLIILFIAGVVSGALGEYIDMTVIFITVGLNALVGFIQEYKANQALQKLQSMVEYKAMLLRDGEKVYLPSENIVVGDILYLETGDRIQADGRIIDHIDLELNEAALTGESEPTKARIKALGKNVSLADRSNMVYRGTSVVNGRATVVITATGANTEIGKIASLVKETKDEKTPLQNQLIKLGKYIGILIIFISSFLFVLGMVVRKGQYEAFDMFETAVAVAVAAIPEGLVISMTIILAVGMQYILKRKALVRKLIAAETLGSVNVICADKTGTLTEGKMRVTRIITSNDDLDFDELKLLHIDKRERHEDVLLAIKIGVLNNDADIIKKEGDAETFEYIGDTTETALLHAGVQSGLDKHNLEASIPRVDEIPFSSSKKYMITLHKQEQDKIIYTKGAPEVIFEKCKYYEENGTVKKMSAKKKKWFDEEENKLTSDGLRVLAVAYKKADKKKTLLKTGDLENLVFVGLIALSDPLRSDVKETIKIAKNAGIKVVMITGDHVKTAQSIGRQINIPHSDEVTFDGKRLEEISDDELQEAVKRVSIFARVDPKHKIRIVRAFQNNDDVVAMTGDGVNDAPALKGSDIGVAVGSGTDVSKEISDIVLLDDNLSTIVAAVEEGRRIYQNIRKVVLYLLSGSFAEIVLISGSIIAGLPLAVAAVQILWVNLIEDSFPNMALAFDKGDKENMSDPPRKKNDPLIDKEMKVMIAIISIVSNFVLFGLFLYYWNTTGDIALTRTIVFVGLGIDSLLYIYSVRSMRHMIWQTNPFNNRYLTYAILFGWLMLLGAVYFAPLQILLKRVPLNLSHWIILMLFGMLNVTLIEVIKNIFIVLNKRSKK